ncbi:MAG TPA: DUF1657 domain-containing protein [Bacillota bacterium]|nr:DUF1657 domain-containing protein [Bacillota bacterium]
MTVGERMHKTLANLEGAAADLQMYAMDAQDRSAKQLYSDLNQQLEGIVKTLKTRVNRIEKMEPEYKVRDQQQ